MRLGRFKVVLITYLVQFGLQFSKLITSPPDHDTEGDSEEDVSLLMQRNWNSCKKLRIFTRVCRFFTVGECWRALEPKDWEAKT